MSDSMQQLIPNQKQVVEVKGVKVEVDLSTAQRIDTFAIGTRVKVLRTEYSQAKVLPGVVVGFEPFNDLPTIIVAVFKSSYSDVDIEMIYYNSGSEGVELIAASDVQDFDDLILSRDECLAVFTKQIAKLQAEINGLENKRRYIASKFGLLFKDAKTD